ncbi:MAG: FAD-binding protein [Candidatus Tectomicrobia bacterium]|nr:FAD-binding protein [Candidatus Tectomicrobia bacterium]
MPSLDELGEVHDCDVLVLGAGLAGTFAAVKLSDFGQKNVILVEKGKVGRTGMSAFGAGVMLCKFPDDDDEAWMREMVEHSEYLADQRWIQIMMEHGYDKIKELASFGVTFRMKDGDFERKVGRGQREDRVQRNVMCQNFQMMTMMRKRLRKTQVRLVERVSVTDLLVDGNRVVGAVGFNSRSGDWHIFKARAVINAAGSVAYKGTFLGQRNVTGDAWAMMIRRGVEMISLEFATANTCPKDYDLAGLNMLVGLGGKFINGLGQPFMHHYDPVYADRASLPRLTASMAAEVKIGKGPIYLDARHLTDEQLEVLRFTNPVPMRILETTGVDVRKAPIEWMPAMIGFGTGRGGGARINEACETNLPGLYAVGDAAWSSYQGVSGVGGSNFAYCMVSGEIAARAAMSFIAGQPEARCDAGEAQQLKEMVFAPLRRRAGMLPEDVTYRLQKILFPYETLLIRRGDRLQAALTEVEYLRDHEIPYLKARDMQDVRNCVEVANMVTTAELLLRSALYRTESRGSNVREDCPNTDNINWLKWVTIQCAPEGGVLLNTVELPFEQWPVQPKRKKTLHPVFAGMKKSAAEQETTSGKPKRRTWTSAVVR